MRAEEGTRQNETENFVSAEAVSHSLNFSIFEHKALTKHIPFESHILLLKWIQILGISKNTQSQFLWL